MIELERIDRKGVEQALESASWTVIDTRDSNTFIGWRLNGEKKKGHIPGATDFAAEWIRFPPANLFPAHRAAAFCASCPRRR